jgi:hypothetical protein
MSSVAPAIVIVPAKARGAAYYEAKWRDSAGRQLKRRLGRAWVERDTRTGEWRKRRGHTPTGWLDPRTVHVAAAAMVEQVEREQAEAAKAAALGAAVTFRRVAQEWLAWKRDVKGAAPATLRDNRSLLAEPGTQHRRGRGVARGRIMGRFGDTPIGEITTRDVSRFLSELDAEGMPGANVNKYRALLRDLHVRDAAGHLRRPSGGESGERDGQALSAAARAARPLRAPGDRSARAGVRAR